MKKSFNVIKTVSETAGDKFFTVAITDLTGDTHTETFSEVLLAKFISAGVKFQYDTENEELVDALESAELGYTEVASEGSEYDVYFHKVALDEGELEIDYAGEYLKTYKREASAVAFAKKSANAIVIA